MTLNKYKKNNHQKSNVISISILVIIIFAILSIITIPFIKKSIILKTNIINEEKIIENLNQSANSSENISKELSQIKSDLHKLDSTLLQNDQQITFITNLEKIAESNRIQQSILNFDPDEVGKGKKEVPISLNLSGDYVDFINYLKDLESAPYYISIKNISIKPQSNNVSANIQAITYWE